MSELELDDRAFVAGFRRAMVDFHGNAHRAADQDAARLAARARGLARVETGFMRDHIEVTHGGEGEEYWAEVGIDSAQVPYALDQEFGTSKMPAHPFMRPAMLEVEARPSNGDVGGSAGAVEADIGS